MEISYPDSKYLDSLAIGKVYQELIKKLVKRLYGLNLHYFETKEAQYSVGESYEGVEVKYDFWCTKTHRLSIEVGEKSSKGVARFTPSGILRKDNAHWYMHGNEKRCWIFPKSNLVEYYDTKKPAVVDYDPDTIQKFYLPMSIAYQKSKHVFDINPYICDYGVPPVPEWANCRPCPLYEYGHCKSTGVEVWGIIRKLNDLIGLPCNKVEDKR